jgi:hypothetical protein
VQCSAVLCRAEDWDALDTVECSGVQCRAVKLSALRGNALEWQCSSVK